MLYFKFFTHQNKIQLDFLPTMNKLNWVFYSLYMTCIVFLLQVYQALKRYKMYTSSFILLMYIILYSLNSYCRKLEVGGTLMSPHTTDFNTFGSSWYAFCALQIWNTIFLYICTLHSHGNFSFQVTKVLSVTECFRFVELLSVFTAPFKISSMISVATILLWFTTFSISVSKCQKYAWTKLPDVCPYEGKKKSWDKTAIFLSV